MQSVNTQEKQIKIDGLNINYKQIGNGDVPIILLHGWGVSSDKYSAFAEHLSQFSIFNFQFSIFVPDLPGFGKSDEPNENWNLDDYVEFTDKFIKSATQARGFELIKNILKKMQPKFSVLKESLQEQKKIQQNNHNNLQNIDEGQIKILNQVQ
ncbi:MAG: alpha/beta hydrolase, partial [Candidatus Pacebacteria bacterium]|nr:alpha/beta hydrolase [Candidatus Paceibacterota bacterium]